MIFTLPGCASNQEWRKSITLERLLWDRNPKSYQNFITLDAENLAKIVGADKSGFIQPDKSSQRIEFENNFPALVPDEKSVDYAINNQDLSKLGQALAWSADLDLRTSGYLKDENGRPISITGRFDLSKVDTTIDTISNATVTMAAHAAMGQAAVVTPGVSPALSGLGIGLAAGVLTSIIDAQIIGDATNGFIASKTFGERMRYTISFPSAERKIPKLMAISPHLGNKAQQETAVLINNKIIKRVFIKGTDEVKFNYMKDIFIVSAVGIYRGEKYTAIHPETNGWEYQITNINKVEVPSNADGIYNPYGLLQGFEALSKAIHSAC